ncbi:hypothetical protein K505DRAFT_396817, partial [Melanomma pulvis-pyrius CBS 109.77]
MHTSLIAIFSVLFFLHASLSSAAGASLNNPNDVASSLRYRRQICKASNNCPPSPQQRALDDLPWKRRARGPGRMRKTRSTSPSSPKPSKVEKQARKVSASSAYNEPHLHPVPTIETTMAHPSMSRLVYSRLVRDKDVLQTQTQAYSTVMRVPKPPNMRVLDLDLLQTAELAAYRRRKRLGSGSSVGRSRSSTGGSASTTGYIASADSDSKASTSGTPEPSSPSGIYSTSNAAIASSMPASPQFSAFPPHYAPSPDTTILGLATLSDPPSRASSPVQSFHSSLSTIPPSFFPPSTSPSDRSIAPSPASSIYPSPPSSPHLSHRSSSAGSGEEYKAYPSPPASPHHQLDHAQRRRAFSFPPAPAGPTPPRTHSAALSLSGTSNLSHSAFELDDAPDYDLGEQKLGGGSIDEDREDEAWNWSLNGGDVVFGAAGVA